MGVLETYRDRIVESGNVTIEGKKYPFFVLQQSAVPQLYAFVGIEDGNLLAADSIPPRFREYIFWHEVQCNLLRAKEAGRCWHTVKDELERVPNDLLPEYVPFRRKQFGYLVEYYLGRNGMNSTFLDELRGSFGYLLSRPE